MTYRMMKENDIPETVKLYIFKSGAEIKNFIESY